MDADLLEAVRALRAADPDIGVKSLIAKLREQQVEASSKQVREAVEALKAESEAAAEKVVPEPAAAPAALSKRQLKLQAQKISIAAEGNQREDKILMDLPAQMEVAQLGELGEISRAAMIEKLEKECEVAARDAEICESRVKDFEKEAKHVMRRSEAAAISGEHATTEAEAVALKAAAVRAKADEAKAARDWMHALMMAAEASAKCARLGIKLVSQQVRDDKNAAIATLEQRVAHEEFKYRELARNFPHNEQLVLDTQAAVARLGK
jgi:hypothetical protein